MPGKESSTKKHKTQLFFSRVPILDQNRCQVKHFDSLNCHWSFDEISYQAMFMGHIVSAWRVPYATRSKYLCHTIVRQDQHDDANCKYLKCVLILANIFVEVEIEYNDI